MNKNKLHLFFTLVYVGKLVEVEFRIKKPEKTALTERNNRGSIVYRKSIIRFTSSISHSLIPKNVKRLSRRLMKARYCRFFS
ncbi:hypothetical protein M5V91_16150 [Cytobacillus pseudoceanisediminis]|nr:hypothetical protein [Cytobacillus pseudoceanisediminis]UQX52528.1 hypothetical protein M5V91_16150 [Cytobacillus pseudoceanisediminis]